MEYVTTALGVPVKVTVAVWFAQTDNALAEIAAVGKVTADIVRVCDRVCEHPPRPAPVTVLSVKVVADVTLGTMTDAVPDAFNVTDCVVAPAV